MHAIDTSTAVNGQFTDGDPLAGIAATAVDSAWLNDLQNNLLNLLSGADIEPTKGDATQVLTAVQDLIANAVAGLSTGGSGGSTPPPTNQVGPYGMPTRAAIPGSSNDANALVQSGFYVATGATANLPAFASSGVLIVAGNVSGVDGGQIYIDKTGVAATRGRTADAYGAWSVVTARRQVLLAVDGYDWDPNTGEFLQWGAMNGPFSEGPVNVVFPLQFDTCFGIRGWVVNSSADITIGTWIDEVSVTGVRAIVLVNRVSSGSSNIPAFKWEARGVRAAPPPPP